jgi:hypothetical protein
MNPRFQFAELEEHPLRQRLNNEFHARPPIPLSGRCWSRTWFSSMQRIDRRTGRART